MDSIANGGGCRPCKIKQVQLDVTDAIIHFIGDGSSLSHLNASNVDFGTLSTTVFPVSGVTAGTYGSSSNVSQVTIDQYGRVTNATNVAMTSSQWTGLPGSPIYYIPGVGIGSSTPATANLQVTGNVYVSNALTTTNVFATTYYGDGGLLSNIAAQWTGNKGSPIYYIPGVGIGSSSPATANLQVTGNVYVSNALTTPNVNVTDTLNVTGTLTANAANATFMFDTFTIPYINTQYLNVASNIVLTGNLSAPLANIATLNVNYLTVNSAILVTLAVTNNLYAANALTTTNIFAAGFTSNVSNTNFFYSTLTVPFVYSTTLNVASTANVLTVTVPGSIGKTSVTVTGNVYASDTIASANPMMFRNRLINGGMLIWQRNTAALSTTTSIYTTADRWCGALGTSGLTLSQSSTVPAGAGFIYSLQVGTTTATVSTPLIEQRIEYLNISDLVSGTNVTVSFWASQTAGTLMPLSVGLYYATAVNNFGTQTLAVSAAQTTPTLTATLAYYILTFTLTSSLGATNGLSLRFTTGATASTGTFLLTGVQLEKGSTASPFEVRPYATELGLAQRYYYQLTSPTAAVQGSGSVYAVFGTATGITTTAFWLPIQFPVSMRTPNYTLSNSVVSTNFQLIPTGTTTITSVGLQTDSFTPVSATLNFVGTNIVAGTSYLFRTNGLTGANTAFFGFSSEL